MLLNQFPDMIQANSLVFTLGAVFLLKYLPQLPVFSSRCGFATRMVTPFPFSTSNTRYLVYSVSFMFWIALSKKSPKSHNLSVLLDNFSVLLPALHIHHLHYIRNNSHLSCSIPSFYGFNIGNVDCRPP